MAIEWVRTGENDPQGREATEKLQQLLTQFNTDSRNPAFQRELGETVNKNDAIFSNRTRYTEDVLEDGLKTINNARDAISKAMQEGVWQPGM